MAALAAARAHILNPNLTATAFNNWYNTNLLPAFMHNHNSSLGVRYEFAGYPYSTAAPRWDYLALYHTHDNATKIQSIVNNALQGREIGPKDVEIQITTWRNIEVLESLMERQGTAPPGRAPYLLLEMAEPKKGLEQIWDDWYRLQHMDMVSMLKGFVRGTRWRATDANPLSWMVIQEINATDYDPYLTEVLSTTDFAIKATEGWQHEDPTFWKLIYETGDEKL